MSYQKQQYRRCRNPYCEEFIEMMSRKVFCSKACKQRDYRRRKSEHKTPPEKFVRYCKCCGQKFLTNYKGKMFHTDSCRVNYWRQQTRLDEAEAKDKASRSTT